MDLRQALALLNDEVSTSVPPDQRYKLPMVRLMSRDVLKAATDKIATWTSQQRLPTTTERLHCKVGQNLNLSYWYKVRDLAKLAIQTRNHMQARDAYEIIRRRRI